MRMALVSCANPAGSGGNRTASQPGADGLLPSARALPPERPMLRPKPPPPQQQQTAEEKVTQARPRQGGSGLPYISWRCRGGGQAPPPPGAAPETAVELSQQVAPGPWEPQQQQQQGLEEQPQQQGLEEQPQPQGRPQQLQQQAQEEEQQQQQSQEQQRHMFRTEQAVGVGRQAHQQQPATGAADVMASTTLTVSVPPAAAAAAAAAAAGAGWPLRTPAPSPVLLVSKSTDTKRLAGSVAAALSCGGNCLMFASGYAAVNTAVKALATAHKMLTHSTQMSRGRSGGGGGGDGEAGAADGRGAEREWGRQDGEGACPATGEVVLHVRPMLRGAARGAAGWACALDVTCAAAPPGERSDGGSETSGDGSSSDSSGDAGGGGDDGGAQRHRYIRVTSGSDELRLAQSVVANMPRQGDTVLRAGGPFAVANAVATAAIARQLLQRRCPADDLVMQPLWSSRPDALHGSRGMLQLRLLRCRDPGAAGESAPAQEAGGGRGRARWGR